MSSFGPVDASNVETYCKALDDWHSELSMVHKGLNRVLSELGTDQHSKEAEDEISSIGYILVNRLQDLVETCPFPEREWQRDARLISQELEA